MQRFLLTLAALFMMNAAFAQTAEIPISGKTNKISFQRVIPTEGTNTEVFNRIAGEWLRSAYKNPQAVVIGNDGSTITLYRYPGKSVDPTHEHIPSNEGVSYYTEHGLPFPGGNTGVYDKGGSKERDDGAIFAKITEKAFLNMDNIVLNGCEGDTVLRPLISVSNGGTIVINGEQVDSIPEPVMGGGPGGR